MIEDYYQRKYIGYLLLEGCKDREFAFLGRNNTNVRALSVKCLFDLQRALELVQWGKNKPNMYRSVARISKIPNFTFNPKKRSEETIVWFEDQCQKDIFSYDLFFDFDKTEEASIYDVLVEVKEFKSYLDSYNVPYYVVFSGNKGFHVIVDGKYLPIKEIKDGNVYPHKTISESVKTVFGFKFLDLRNNGVYNRLCKLPYSLVGENIALPLDPEQVENFKVEDMKLDKIIVSTKVRLVRRGILEQPGDSNGVNNFIKSITFK